MPNCSTRIISPSASQPPTIRRWWDLDELERQYESFIRAHEPALRGWEQDGPPTEQEAFAAYVRMLTDWRRLPYLDPGLPAELLPDGWVGIRAAELVLRLARAARGTGAGVREAHAQRGLTTAMPWISTRAAGSHSRVTPTPAMAG